MLFLKHVQLFLSSTSGFLVCDLNAQLAQDLAPERERLRASRGKQR